MDVRFAAVRLLSILNIVMYNNNNNNNNNNEVYLYSAKEPNERHSWRFEYQLFLHTNTHVYTWWSRGAQNGVENIHHTYIHTPS